MEPLPPLPLEEWEPTKDTLHLWVQIVGKVKMASLPPKNHWWHVPLYVDVRGLTTRLLHSADGTGFEIRFDFVDHELVVETAGANRSIELVDGLSVADFDARLHGALGELDVAILEKPFGLPAFTTPFPDDREHATYDAEAVARFWHVLDWSGSVLDEFSGWYCGKQSPVHLFWHGLDLAVTRFSGRPATPMPDVDPVSREAYTHEVISFGFWAGDKDVREPTYYSYTLPEPAGLRDRPLAPSQAFWADQGTGSLARLPYEVVRTAPDPHQTLLGFLENAYEAGADAAGWDRAGLMSTWCPIPDSMTRRQRLTLVAAVLGSSIAMIDGTIVNVALPAIQRDLGGGLPAQQWVSNAYLLVLGSLILVGGSLGDIYGVRRVFAIGVGAFGVFSVACALAPTVEVLIAARALQGAAGALLTPSSLAIIVMAFPTGRAAAIGAWTAWGGIAAVVGPLVGGVVVDNTSWRWIFALNVPLVVATILLVLAAVPAGGHRVARRVDWVGAALCALGLAGLVFGLIEQPRYGWADARIILALALGVVLVATFLVWERRSSEPMLKLDLFARRNFTVANVETLTVYAGISILLFFLVIYLQQVAGWSAVRSGLVTLPLTIVMFLLSRRFGMLADRLGPRLFMGIGPLVAAAGVLLLLRVGMNVSFWTDLLPGLLIFSLGLSITVAPLTATVLADADESDAGIASAVNNAVARVAGLLGISVVGVVVASRLTGDTFAPDQSSVDAFHIAMLICAALVAAGGVIGLLGIVNPRRTVLAEGCAGGQLVGAPEAAA